MELNCPHCGVRGISENSNSGRSVTCPQCCGMFKFKAVGGQAVGKAVATKRKSTDEVLEQFESPFQVGCPHCLVVGVVDESARGKKLRCPECFWLFIGLPEEEPVFAEGIEESGEIVEKTVTPEIPVPDQQIFDESAESETKVETGPEKETSVETKEEKEAGVETETRGEQIGDLFVQNDEPVSAVDLEADAFDMDAADEATAVVEDDIAEEVVRQTVVEPVRAFKDTSGPAPAEVENTVKVDPVRKIVSAGEAGIIMETAAAGDRSFSELDRMLRLDVSELEGTKPGIVGRKQEKIVRVEKKTAEDPPLIKPAGDKPIIRKSKVAVSGTKPKIFRETGPGSVKPEPSGAAEKQCWQCGKRGENVDFSSVYDRLYCSDCFLDDEFSILQIERPALPENQALAGKKTEEQRLAASTRWDEGELAVESVGFWGRVRNFFRSLFPGKQRQLG